jgi:HSP20 family protein
MMVRKEGDLSSVEHIHSGMRGILQEPVPSQRRISARQHKIWRPPTDVYETGDCVIVKVEIAGMKQEDFALSLEANTLLIRGVRHDPAAKLGYQQMEILYGHFETHVHLPKAIDEDDVEATYQDGFLHVRLPKLKPHQVPVVGTEDSS